MAKVAQDEPERQRSRRCSTRWRSTRPAPPTDKTYAKQMQAAAILEPLFQQMPEHPGIAHYIIHAYDAPPLADQGARRGAPLRVAGAGDPARAPHAVAHLHARRILEGIDRDQPSVGGRRAQGQRRRRGAARARLPDLRVSAARAGQGGQGRRSIAPWPSAAAHGSAAGAAGAGGVCHCRDAGALCARTRRLGRGGAADAAPMPTTPYTEAITHFARAVGAARSGNPAAAARRHPEARGPARQAQVDAGRLLDGDVDIQRRVALAWVAFAEGKKDEGARRDECRRRCRRRDREVGGFARAARAGARALRLHAARGESAEGRARGVRSDDEKGAASLPQHLRRRRARRELAGDKAKAATYYKQLLDLRKKPTPNGRRSWKRRMSAARVDVREPAIEGQFEGHQCSFRHFRFFELS